VDLPTRWKGYTIPFIFSSSTQPGLVTMGDQRQVPSLVSLRLAAKGMKDRNNGKGVQKKGFVPRSKGPGKTPRNRLHNIPGDALNLPLPCNNTKRVVGLKKLLGHNMGVLFMRNITLPQVAGILSQYFSCLPCVTNHLWINRNSRVSACFRTRRYSLHSPLPTAWQR
jgi:hypothetical protein